MNMKKLLLAIGTIGVLTTGCKKGFLDVNENPNTPGSSRSDFQFTGAAGNTANTMTGPNQLGGAWTGIYGFSTSFTGGGQQKTYVFTNTDFNYWDGIYDNITDYNYVVSNGEAQGYGYLVGPAMIMRAYQYAKLVDVYNNIPYSAAFNIVGDVTPSYDDGQAVYEDLIKKLDDAITRIKAATFPSSAPEDIVFKGNKTNWIKLANSLKLRMLIRQTAISGRDAYITTEINKIITEGSGLLTTNAFINPTYAKQTGKLNPWYSNMGYNENDVEQQNHRFYKVNAFLINFLKNTNDIFRLQRKANPIVQGYDGNPTNPANYAGVRLGQQSGATETIVSSVGSSMVTLGDATRGVSLFTAAEAFFLQAEAAQRYGLFGDAATLYQSGVIEGFKLDAGISQGGTTTATAQVATDAANAYLAAGGDNVNFAASTNKISAIIHQKWIALANFDNFTAWNEWKRTGFPAVPVSDQAGSTTKQPRRLYYPLSEQNTNLENLQAQGTINVYDGRIFWDKR